jgi:hypothetical protein
VQEEVVAGGLAAPDLADRRLDEVELAVEQQRVVRAVGHLDAEVDALDADVVVVARGERAVGVAVDRGAEHEAALALGERRHVGAAAREAHAQRRLGTVDHDGRGP